MFNNNESILEWGIYFKNLREQKNLTQKELSEQSTVSDRSILRLENGQSIPRDETLRLLLKVLKVPLEQVQVDIVNQRTKFDNQITHLIDLFAKGRDAEALAKFTQLSTEVGDYQKITHYQQSLLLAKAHFTGRSESNEARLAEYIDCLRLTQPSLLLNDTSEELELALDKIETAIFSKTEYGVLKQIGTTLGRLGRGEQAVSLFCSLLSSFDNEFLDVSIKTMYTSTIHANIAYYYIHVNFEPTLAHLHIQAGLAHCRETGNTRCLDYLEKLAGELTKPLA